MVGTGVLFPLCHHFHQRLLNNVSISFVSDQEQKTSPKFSFYSRAPLSANPSKIDTKMVTNELFSALNWETSTIFLHKNTLHVIYCRSTLHLYHDYLHQALPGARHDLCTKSQVRQVNTSPPRVYTEGGSCFKYFPVNHQQCFTQAQVCFLL